MRARIIGWLAVSTCLALGSAHSEERLIGVRDTIALQQFVDPDIESTARVSRFSPDGRYFVVITQRGLLARDRIEATLWLFDADAERKFLTRHARVDLAPQPHALATRTGTTEFYEQPSETVAITAVRWAEDSRSLYFLGRDDGSEWRLYQVDVATGKLSQLTPDGQSVAAYSVADQTVLYAVSMPYRAAPLPREVVGVGVGLSALLVPDWQFSYPNQDELWAYAGGTVHPVVDRESGRAVRLNKHFDVDSTILAPSPDGRFAVIAQAVSSVPVAWEQYEPGANIGRIGAASAAALRHAMAYEVPERFALVDLTTGQAAPMIDAPLGRAISWWSGTLVAWSRDSHQVLLSNVFLPLLDVPEVEKSKRQAAPVVALYDIGTRTATAVASFKHSQLSDPKRWQVAAVRWDEAGRTLTIDYPNGGPAPETYPLPGHSGPLHSHVAGGASHTRTPLEITIVQGLNAAPTVHGALNRASHGSELWDPNPQLGAFSLGSAEPYDWKDREGRTVKGVLIKPPRFDPTRHYPLVIEARAYHQDRFVLDGTYATAVAARVMAADDLLVLQAGEPTAPERDMFNGATARALEGYEAVVDQLTREGHVDPDRVGIIGFSRTCDTVMYAITHAPRLFAAATVANGLTYGPLQYLSAVDSSPVANIALQQWDLHYQGKPLGSGLTRFVHENPIFNISAVATPVRIETRSGRIPQLLTTDWESYAALRSLDKPVDLVMLPYASHVVSMPSDVLASQQGEVDWMRFWLQGYEDSDPAKADQYRRWEHLCQLQTEGNPSRPQACVSTRH